MTNIDSVAALADLGRVRLSRHFFMREMLYSEVGNFYGVQNFPEDPAVAVEAGRQLCERVLEPIRHAFGHLTIRSAYRSPTLNGFCHERYLAGERECWCVDNASNAAEHIWDMRDAHGNLGATATVVVPAYLPYYDRTGDWRPLAWWIRDNVPSYADIFFFRRLCAFNIRWYEGQTDKTITFLDPPVRDVLTSRGMANFDGDHSDLYADVIGPLLQTA